MTTTFTATTANEQLIEYCELTQKLLFKMQVEIDKDIDKPTVLARYMDVCQELDEKNFNTATAYNFLGDVAYLLEMLGTFLSKAAE